MEEGQAAHKTVPNVSMISMLPALRGKNANDFFKTLSTLMSIAGWSHEQAIALVSLKLEGPAKLFFESSLWDRKFEKIEELRDIFVDHFKETKSLSRVISEFNACVQSPAESVRDYATRLEGLVHKTLVDTSVGEKEIPTEFQKQLLLSQFISGLCSAIKAQVMIQDPDSFAEAKSVALRVEESLRCVTPNINAVSTSAQIGMNEFTQVLKSTTESYTQAMESMTKRMEEMQVQIQRLAQNNNRQFEDNHPFRHSYNQGQFRQNQTGRQAVECFYCHKRGHIARNCFKKARDMREPRPGVEPAGEQGMQPQSSSLN